MEEEIKYGCQFISGEELSDEQIREMIASAYLFSNNVGPVVMLCSEAGYDFIMRNELNDIYIDVIALIETSNITPEFIYENLGKDVHIINSLKEIEENLRNLHIENNVLPNDCLSTIEQVIEKESILKTLKYGYN
jgi:hypothetical protein